MPCSEGREQVIARKRFIQASDGINTCLPDGSGVQSISSGLITSCTSALMAGSVLALQTWKAICWLWGQVQTALSDITTLQDDVEAIEAQLPAVHTGTPTLTPLSGAGSGATATLITGSTDTQGGILLTLGSGVNAAGAAQMVTIAFGTAFAAPVFPTFGCSGGNGAGRMVNCAAGFSGPTASITIGYWDTGSTLSQGNVVRLYYKIGFVS